MALLGPLRAFDEVIRLGSIRKASVNLNVAPSSISRSILILEHEIGTALFERSRSGVGPTHAGKLVAEFARDFVLQYDALRDDLNDMGSGARRMIRIGVVEGMLCEGAIAAVHRFRTKFPDVIFRILVQSTAEIAAALKAGECDIGISHLQQPDVALKIGASFPDPVQLAVSPTHDLATRESVGLAEILSQPLAIVEDDPITDLVQIAVASEGLTLRPVLIANSVEAVRSFVRGGGGIAMLSRRTVERDVQQAAIRTIPIESPTLCRAGIDIVMRQERRTPRIVRLFGEEVANIAVTLNNGSAA